MVGGVYGSGMHDFIVRECEVGTRVATAEDDELCGFGPLFALHYEMWLKTQPCKANAWMLNLLDQAQPSTLN